MQTAPQEKKQGLHFSLFTSLAGMLITFLAGIYVGLHPTWIPIKLGASSDDNPNLPLKLNVAPTTSHATTPASSPSTAPVQ